MNDINKILDESFDRLNCGQSVEDCLADYPEEIRREIRPLLDAAKDTRKAYSFLPNDKNKQKAYQRFEAARQIASKQCQSSKHPLPWKTLFPRLVLVAASTAAVALLVFIGYNTIKPDEMMPPVSIASADPRGNMAFLISDEVNAIADFSSLYVTIEKVALKSDTGSIEFEPEIAEVDLTLLPGDVTQEIWRGNIPAGTYSRITIYVSNVHGTLKANGDTVTVKLPSNKLHINMDFKVTDNSLTSFVFDLTVISTGNSRNQRYQLKPQASESSVSYPSIPASEANEDEKAAKPDKKTFLPFQYIARQREVLYAKVTSIYCVIPDGDCYTGM
jgi:hypothetical protein